jgi:hypothetical protein
MSSNQINPLEREAASGGQGLLSDFWAYLQYTRKWWILPIVLVLALLGVVFLLGGTGAAPFVYTLF